MGRKPADPNARRSGAVQSAEVGLIVLKSLGEMGGSASLTALAARLDEHPAKVHRYLGSLVAAGFVHQEPTTSRYVLGREAILVGLAALRCADAVVLARAELAGLCERLEVSCFTAIAGDQGPVIVNHEEPAESVVVYVRAGSVLPLLWSATGRVFAAFMPAKDVETQIAREFAAASADRRRQLPTLASVDAMLQRVRETGYATVKGTMLRGVSGLAAPIFDVDGRVAACLATLGTHESLDLRPGGPLVREILECTDRVTRQIGGRTPVPPSPSPASR